MSHVTTHSHDDEIMFFIDRGKEIKEKCQFIRGTKLIIIRFVVVVSESIEQCE